MKNRYSSFLQGRSPVRKNICGEAAAHQGQQRTQNRTGKCDSDTGGQPGDFQQVRVGLYGKLPGNQIYTPIHCRR